MPVMLIGSMEYLLFGNDGIKYIFAHIGALGVIGLLSYTTGVIAGRKGLKVKKAVSFTFFPSIILGAIAVYAVDPPDKMASPYHAEGSYAWPFV